MALAKSSGIFGVRDLKITALLTDVSGSAPTYNATWVDIPGIKSLGMEKNVTEKENRGDEMLLDTESTLESISVSWENAEIPLDACAIIDGGALTTSGTGETEKHTLVETGASSGGYFKLQALAKRGSNDVGDIGVELFKVKGTLTYSMKGEDFAVCSFSGKAIPVRGTIDTVVNPIRKLTFSAADIVIA